MREDIFNCKMNITSILVTYVRNEQLYLATFICIQFVAPCPNIQKYVNLFEFCPMTINVTYIKNVTFTTSFAHSLTHTHKLAFKQ